MGADFGREKFHLGVEHGGQIMVDGKPFFPIAIYDRMRHLGVEYSATAPRLRKEM